MIVKITKATYYLYYIWGKVKIGNIRNVQIQNKGIFKESKFKILSFDCYTYILVFSDVILIPKLK